MYRKLTRGKSFQSSGINKFLQKFVRLFFDTTRVQFQPACFFINFFSVRFRYHLAVTAYFRFRVSRSSVRVSFRHCGGVRH